MDKKTKIKLPNGMILVAGPNSDPAYPGLQISLKGTGSGDTDETLCFVEYNQDKPVGNELCICVYTHGEDDYVYYASYHDKKTVKSS